MEPHLFPILRHRHLLPRFTRTELDLDHALGTPGYAAAVPGKDARFRIIDFLFDKGIDPYSEEVHDILGSFSRQYLSTLEETYCCQVSSQKKMFEDISLHYYTNLLPLIDNPVMVGEHHGQVYINPFPLRDI